MYTSPNSCSAPLTSIVEKKYYGNQWCPSTVWFQSFFKIYSFVFSRRKKLIQVCNNLRVSKWWQNFNFWVEYPMPKICRWMLAISLPLHHSKHNILLEYHGVNATHTHTHTHTYEKFPHNIVIKPMSLYTFVFS